MVLMRSARACAVRGKMAMYVSSGCALLCGAGVSGVVGGDVSGGPHASSRDGGLFGSVGSKMDMM